jgi:hypothetical protein
MAASSGWFGIAAVNERFLSGFQVVLPDLVLSAVLTGHSGCGHFCEIKIPAVVIDRNACGLLQAIQHDAGLPVRCRAFEDDSSRAARPVEVTVF